RSGYPLDRGADTTLVKYLPWTSSLDLRVAYNLGALPVYGGCNLRLLADARNLLGRDNILALRRSTGLVAPSPDTMAGRPWPRTSATPPQWPYRRTGGHSTSPTPATTASAPSTCSAGPSSRSRARATCSSRVTCSRRARLRSIRPAASPSRRTACSSSRTRGTVWSGGRRSGRAAHAARQLARASASQQGARARKGRRLEI